MKVKAITVGFYGSLRQEGDEFDVPDDEPESSWFKPEEGAKDAAKEPKGSAPKGQSKT